MLRNVFVMGAGLLAGVAAQTPDPLVMRSGAKIETAAAWRGQRRPEIRRLFEQQVYGRMPAAPTRIEVEVLSEDPEALAGAATRREVRVSWQAPGGEASLALLVFLPNKRSAPAPVFLGLNFYGNHSVTDDPGIALSKKWIPSRAKGVVKNRATEASRGTAAARWSVAQTVAEGWGVATLYHGDLEPDRGDDLSGVRPLYYREGQRRPDADEWGALAAWAFGLHRALDYLQQADDVDGERVAVMGHSRNGKAALLAGATDERFAWMISNQSGCGGAALSRRRVGETVKAINDRFPHWFCRNFAAFNNREADLPVDQHLLVALCAPRPVLVCSAVKDKWADPEGEFLALRGAEPVYRLLGTKGLGVDAWPDPDDLVGGALSYHIRPGRHAVGPVDWAVFIRFVEANQ